MRAKREARVLVSKCYSGICLGIVLRGSDVDGAVAGPSCSALCRELETKGYTGELRYAVGDCRCGLPTPPSVTGETESLILALSSSLPLWMSRSMRILTGDP